jgi:hypothetical protein
MPRENPPNATPDHHVVEQRGASAAAAHTFVTNVEAGAGWTTGAAIPLGAYVGAKKLLVRSGAEAGGGGPGAPPADK